jgi:glutamate dehydrogenase
MRSTTPPASTAATTRSTSRSCSIELVRDGELTVKQRNELLVEMTDEVADLVLDDNRAQTLALMIARTQSLAMVNVHARYLDTLEAEGYTSTGARVPALRQADRRAPERTGAACGRRSSR